MIQLLFCALLGAGGLFADDPKTPDLSDYRTVKDAKTREVVPPRAGRGGETGYLGVSLRRDGDGRILVEEVQAGSPAEKAGIKKGDVLKKVGGEAARSPEALRDWLQAKGPGEEVKFVVARGEETVECSATLVATSRPRTVGTRRPYLGITMGEPTPGEGVPIEDVAPDSPATLAGFRSGDVIFKVEGIEVGSPMRVKDILNEKKPGDDVEIGVRRGTEEVVLRPRLTSEAGAAPRGGEGPNAPGPGRPAGQNPASATLDVWKKPVFRVAVIGIEYPDIKHNDKMPPSAWQDALLSEGTYHDKENPAGSKVHGSLNDYFREQSGGAFHLEGKVFDWIEVGKKRQEYVLGSGTTNITAVLVEALEKIAKRDGKDAFKDFDGFLFLYAGEPVFGNRGGVYYPHAGTIRSFQGQRWPYVLVPEGASRPTPVGGVAKEFGQMLGLPDLAARPENRGSEGLGVWSALSAPTKTARPQHFDAWSKEKLGWITPTVIDPTVPQKLVLSPIEDSPKECFKILVRSDGSEYFLLENRRKTGFDSDLPADGLLIWRVVHDRPLLEESHGVEGPPGPTVFLESVPYPSPANRSFTPDTIPSSRSPLGGGLPVSLTDIRRLPDGRITFQVGYEYR